jgi:dienelactone hydrolase
MRYVRAQAATIVLGALAAPALLLWMARVPLLALLLVPELFPDGPAGPLRWFVPPPQRQEQAYHTPAGELVPADLYLPRSMLPPGRLLMHRPGVLLFVGIYTPKDDPRLVHLAGALARAGIVVLVPESAAMLEGRLEPREIELLVTAFRALLERPEVDPRRAGFVGFSTGGSLALVAAADPRIRDRVAFVHAFGSYADALTFLHAAVTHTIRLDGRTLPWEPDGVTRTVLAQTLIDAVPHSADRLALYRLFLPDGMAVEGLPPPEARRDLETAAARAVFDLLTRPPAEQVPRLLEELPASLREGLRRMSPVTVAGDVRCAVLLMHDREDRFVPVTESRLLAARLRALGHRDVRYTEFSLFEHVVPGRHLGVLALVAEFWKLYMHLLALMRWLA